MIKNIKEFFEQYKKNRTIIIWLFAFLMFGISFTQNKTDRIKHETRQVQKEINSRMKILDKYAKKALDVPVDQWVNFNNFPKDMVLYKYNADTLQSWVNLFPISNDEVDLLPLWYRIHNLNNQNLFNTPLAYLSNDIQYANLGTSWYLIKPYKEGRVKLIAGLLIKSDYSSENAALNNKTNPKLKLDKHYSTIPLTIDDSHIIYYKNKPIFSIINNSSISIDHPRTEYRWIAILFVILAFFSLHDNKRSFTSLFLLYSGLIITHIFAKGMINVLESDVKLFSPILYADSNLYDSLGRLLISHLYIFLYVLAIFMLKKKLYSRFLKLNYKLRKLISKISIALPILLLIYIHISLRSLMLNSNIVLELYRIDEISFYTVLIYLSYALLFVTLFMSLNLVEMTFRDKIKIVLSPTKIGIIFSLIISLYSISTIGIYGFQREKERTRVISNNLSIKRDISLELRLRYVERFIATDNVINLLINVPNGDDIIRNRIYESYLTDISEKYNIRITICNENTRLLTESYAQPVNCFEFFNNKIIYKYGIKLSPFSPFYYLDNNNDQINYIGCFNYLRNNILYDLFIEIESKTLDNSIGYPSLLTSTLLTTKKRNLPYYYSYAKYHDNRLISKKGSYNFPIEINKRIKNGYSTKLENGYVKFYNKVSDNNVIIILRKSRSILIYLIAFSYTLLFFGLFLLLFNRPGRKKTGELIAKSKYSLRTKITYLLSSALVTSLLFIGIGSVLFVVNIIHDNNELQVEQKIHTIQSTLSEMCKYAKTYTEINTTEMFNAMDQVSNNTHVDINLFDPHGRLIRSTNPEIFNQYLVSSRIDNNAYYPIIFQHQSQVILEKKLGNLKYYSLSAPIFNLDGKLITIANIPYFKNESNWQDSSSIIAAIVNLYLILLLAVLLGGVTISNSITKPLAIISKKLEDMDFSKKGKQINYKSNDELGTLVKAYNKMVVDLDSSTKKLAQNEREQAWKEMARQIAHEIKNPLTPMRLSIQHLIRLRQRNIEGWEKKFDELSVSLLDEIDILSETASEFSSFAKFYNEDNAVIDLISILNEQRIFFDHRENIKMLFINMIDNAYVYARKSQITRAFVNLISNAIQAIEPQGGGKIRIIIKEEDNFYYTRIEDNGEGVSDENLNKLFKPNFTTKSGGTGLGLAICKSIMEQSNGDISYERSDMGGACFIVKLPKYIEKRS